MSTLNFFVGIISFQIELFCVMCTDHFYWLIREVIVFTALSRFFAQNCFIDGILFSSRSAKSSLRWLIEMR